MVDSMKLVVRRISLFCGAALMISACGKSAPPPAAPKTAVVKPAPPPPPPPPSATPEAPPPPAKEEPAEIVIHEADLYGHLLGRQGKTLTMASLLVTSSTHPEIGNKGLLFRKVEGNDTEWAQIAEVEVKSKLDERSHIQLTILDEAKDDKGKSPFMPAKTKLKLRWQF